MYPKMPLTMPTIPEMEKLYTALLEIHKAMGAHYQRREVADKTIGNLSRERLMLIDKGMDEIRALGDPEVFIALGNIFHDLLEIEINEIEQWRDAHRSLKEMISGAIDQAQKVLIDE